MSKEEVVEARKEMVDSAERLRATFYSRTLSLRKDSFLCGADCVDRFSQEADASHAIREFNKCVVDCQKKINRVETISTTFLDALNDRTSNCLENCLEKIPCAIKCYKDGAAWIQSKENIWKVRIDEVIKGTGDTRERQID